MDEKPKVDVASQVDKPIRQKLKYKPNYEGLHGFVLNKLTARMQLSHDAMSERYQEWDRVDEQVRLYVNLTEGARAGDKTTVYNIDGTIKSEMPFQRSIVIPVSYVILSVRMAQLMNILMGHKPMWPIEGNGPEDVTPSRLMEACLDYDMEQCKALMTLFQFFQDAEKYGMGIIYDTWNEDYGYKMDPRISQITQNPQNRALFQALGKSPQDFKTWDVVREYNNWEPVDPFNFWPDPRVSRASIQKGEFAGHRFERSHLWLKERDVDSGGPYFNLEALPRVKQDSTALKYTPRRDDLHGGEINRSIQDKDDPGFYVLDHLQVKLIPRDWGLSPSEEPEIWWFTMANESVIIRAHESSYDHGQFTYSVGECNPDIHAPFNPGNIENLEPIQKFINWMLNSHFENIRKHLNDALVYGPNFIEEEDILNPGPARHIRLTQRGEELVEMHNINPQNFVHQLALGDVTGPHLQASSFLWEMVTRMFATTDPDMGAPTEEKKTLGEIQKVSAGAAKRVQVAYRMYEIMAFQDLVMRAVANRQQFTSLEQYFRIAGQLAQEVMAAPGGRVFVTPWDLQGNFDFAPRSHILPPDPAKSAIAWSQILFGLGKFPQVWAPGADGKVLDPRLIFDEIARNMGIKHIQQFYRQLTPMDMMAMGGGGQANVQIMPDQQVHQEVQKGNLA